MQKKKKNITGRHGQSAISSKERVKYEATQPYLSVTYQHDRSYLTGKRIQQRSQGTQKQQIATSSKESQTGKKTLNAYDAIRHECMPLIGFIRGYCRVLLRLLSGAAKQQEELFFFPLFFVSEMYATSSLHVIKSLIGNKHIVCKRASP